MSRLLITGVLGFLAGPAVLVMTLALFAGTPFSASCSPSLAVGHVPDGLSATTTDGTPVLLNRTQLTHAATIIAVGQSVPGVGIDGLMIALMAGLTESGLRMYANTGAYPALRRSGGE